MTYSYFNRIVSGTKTHCISESYFPIEQTVIPDRGTHFLHFTAAFFKALSHPVRIKILEPLRAGALSVVELEEGLRPESASISQHPSVLRHKNLLDSHTAGTTVRYRVQDPQIHELLDIVRWIFDNQLLKTRSTRASPPSTH